MLLLTPAWSMIQESGLNFSQKNTNQFVLFFASVSVIDQSLGVLYEVLIIFCGLNADSSVVRDGVYCATRSVSVVIFFHFINDWRSRRLVSSSAPIILYMKFCNSCNSWPACVGKFFAIRSDACADFGSLEYILCLIKHFILMKYVLSSTLSVRVRAPS